MSPDWWRWFRELQSNLSGLDTLSAISPGTLLQSQALVVGNNTIAHGLGRAPTGWIAMRPVGAFTSSGGGGGSIYPSISPPRRYGGAVQLSASDSAPYTLSFTPADGATLIALVVHEFASRYVTSIAQTGVTWARVNSQSFGTATANMMAELWIGHTISSAGTGLTVTFDSTATADTCIIVAEIPEINATSARNWDEAEYSIGTNTKWFDSQDLITEPVPNAGDICIAAFATAFNGSARDLPMCNDWRMIGIQGVTADAEGGVLFCKVAQEAEAQPFLGLHEDSGGYLFVRANFASSLSPIASSSITIPHGVREVSSDATNIVVESVSAVAMDFWVF